jgi:hypothetical protein
MKACSAESSLSRSHAEADLDAKCDGIGGDSLGATGSSDRGGNDILIAGSGDDDLVGDSRDDTTLTPSGSGTDVCRGDAGTDMVAVCEVTTGVP